VEVEKGCENEGLRLDKERMALDEGLKGTILEAMMMDTRKEREREWREGR
jgi:hypothetical protein